MKVAVASLGRFHALDLARELDALGVDTWFYSYTPVRRAERFGLPRHVHRSLLAPMAPVLFWERAAPRLLPERREREAVRALNQAVIDRLEPCDVFICMSGAYLEAARHARERFGARIYLERGSRHILSQKAILDAAGACPPSPFMVERELAGYALADRIAVPSQQAAESFSAHDPGLADKVFVNPYGVDLAQFPQRAGPPKGPPTALFVGGWSRRKGVDVLVDAVRRLPDLKLLHVGALGDAPFPKDDPQFEHLPTVPQWRLAEHYARAHVFALASREEGLALVQAQALASGLPLVCTTRTGGADLAHAPALAARIFVSPVEDAAAFADNLQAALDGAAAPLPDPDRRLLSWSAYGARYAAELGVAAEPRAAQAG